MFKGLLKNLFGTVNSRYINSISNLVTNINQYESKLLGIHDDDFITQTQQWREELNNGLPLDNLLVPAFASVREVARRKLNMRHFDVQLMGGITLHNGMVAEMKTGEGKTLVATLAAYLNALSDKGVHVVTVNDYLVVRDMEWMGTIYNALGMSVGCITQGMGDVERKAAYNSNIVYGTSNEFGFDYLRDNMKHTRDAMVQRDLWYAIVDEADFQFIDEARTPLVISGATSKSSDVYLVCNKIIKLLDSNYYTIDDDKSFVILTDDGIHYVDDLMRANGLIGNNEHIYDVKHISLMHYVNQSLKANFLYKKDRDYITKDNQVFIIDEFTGRIMDGRRYSDGLHQAIEAKEGVEVKSENSILASITFQNFFRLYNKLCGMTGTAVTEEGELQSIYNLSVREIPANLPIKRIDEDDSIYLTESDKYNAVINAVKEANNKGQPVLIGTSSIDKSEYLSNLLTSNGLANHSVLNAKYHEQEAYIIAQAGMRGSITIATNMAGRGTDIKLGGNVDMLMKINPNQSYNELKEQIDRDKDFITSVGGLFVVGTERHDSRRIDNQLRGRSGRQGDPGRSKFFISLEDDLMRAVGMERVGGVLGKLGMKSGDVIEHHLISKSIEKSQQKIEARYYTMRKSIVKYDDVINKQRKIIYEQRNIIIDSGSEILGIFDGVRKNLNSLTISKVSQDNQFIDDLITDLVKSFFVIYGINIDFQPGSSESNFIDWALEKVNKETSELFHGKVKKYSEPVIIGIQKYIWLITLDSLWRDHLLMLDFLRQGVALRSIGQKDPYSEFAIESFKMFGDMLDNIESAVISRFARVDIHSDYGVDDMVIHVSGDVSIDGAKYGRDYDLELDEDS